MAISLKITGDKENKVKGFYLLMTNYALTSYQKDEFYVYGKAKKVMKLLDRKKIKYKILWKGE